MMRKLALPLLFLALPALAETPKLDISNGDMRLVVSGLSKARLELRGVPVFREQSVIIVRPGWNGVHLYPEESDPTCASSREGDVQVGTVVYESPKAFIRYRYELRPDNTCRMVVRYGMKTDDPAEAEVHTYLNANLFQGTRFTADNGRGGTVPALPMAPEKNRILSNTAQATFQTLLGPVDVRLEGGDPSLATFNLDDYRASKQEWARKYPILWFGVGVPLMPKAPAEQTFTMTWRFQPPAARRPQAVAARKAPVGITATPAAQVPWVPDLPVIPRPKAASSEPGAVCRLTPPVCIAIRPHASPEEEQAAREIAADLREVWGVPASVVHRRIAPGDDAPRGVQIALLRLEDTELAKATPANHEYADVRALRSHRHAYLAGSTARCAGVVGADPLGVYYGAQTLKQRLRVDAKGVYIAPTSIVDWPSLEMRGVHWFGGRNSLPFHTRMIERIAAPFKLNTMLYEVDYADWDALKEHDAKRGMSKADIKATVASARKHFIEPIPEIESFGNCDWMFVNGQNKDLLYRDNKRSFDPHNPKSYDLLYRVYQEAIDIFRPRYFHIGHDEITTEKPSIPPTGETESAVKLIVDDVMKVHGWLKGKGLTTMMWSDELLHQPEETETAGNAPTLEDGIAIRKALPKDIVICDWHYWSVTPQSKSVGVFQKDGFPVVGCTWFDRDSTRNFARLLTDRKALGMIQTTWAGWEMSEDMVLRGDPYQFVAYLIGAECAWNGGSLAMDELGYEPEDVFRAAWLRRKVSRAVRPGFTVRLGAGAAKIRVAGGTLFATGKPVALAGALSTQPAPAKLRLNLGNRKARELRFLWNTTLPAESGTIVASLVVLYTDGECVSVPVVYGKQIFGATDMRTGVETLTVDRTLPGAGRPATAARIWRWVNPRPGVSISDVTLCSAQTEAAPVLWGVSGVN